MCPMYVWKNTKTEEVVQVISSVSEIDQYLETVDDPDNWHRITQLPNIRTARTSQTWPDGFIPTSRKNDLNDVKTAEKLKIESFGMKPTERTEINKEIKKLKKLKR